MVAVAATSMDISAAHCVASHDFIAGSEAATWIRGLPSDEHIVQAVPMGSSNGFWLTMYFRQLAFGRTCVVQVKGGRSPGYFLVVSYPIASPLPDVFIEWVTTARGLYPFYHVVGSVCTYVATMCGRTSKNAVRNVVRQMEAWTCPTCLQSHGGKVQHCEAHALLRTHAATVIQGAFREWHSKRNRAAVRIQRATKEWLYAPGCGPLYRKALQHFHSHVDRA